jgi:hypothetical protein
VVVLTGAEAILRDVCELDVDEELWSAVAIPPPMPPAAKARSSARPITPARLRRFFDGWLPGYPPGYAG